MKVFAITALVLGMLLAGGCGPTAQVEQEITVQPTRVIDMTAAPLPTVPPEPTLAPALDETACPVAEPVESGWPVAFCEPFNDNRAGWMLGANPDQGLVSDIRDGSFVIDYNAKNQTGYTTGLSIGQMFFLGGDYILHMRASIDSPFRNCIWGVLVRGAFDAGYEFSIDNQGHYFLSDKGAKGAGRFIGNLKKGSNSAIKWDEPNTITALVEGKDMAFYVNGTLITSHEARDPLRQEVIWSVWAAEGASVTYRFDEILVRQKGAS